MAGKVPRATLGNHLTWQLQLELEMCLQVLVLELRQGKKKRVWRYKYGRLSHLGKALSFGILLVCSPSCIHYSPE
jgi:hypothetical protein